MWLRVGGRVRRALKTKRPPVGGQYRNRDISSGNIVNAYCWFVKRNFREFPTSAVLFSFLCEGRLVSAIGHIYEEPVGVMNFTARLADFLPAHTRSFLRPGELCEELLGLPPDAKKQGLELFDSRKLEHLVGDPKAWARILLQGPTLSVRFTVFREPQGPVLAYCIDGSFTFSSKAGARFESIEQFVQALNCVGLPGYEICSLTHRVYSVTRPQLRILYLPKPD